MNTDTVPQTVLFPDLFDKPLVATDQQHASSDGGAVLLKAAEQAVRVDRGVRPRRPSAREGPARARGPARAADLASRAAIPMATMGTASRTTPFTSCCSGGTRSRATRSPRNRRSRGLKTTSALCHGAELAMSVIERHQRRRRGHARRITIDLDPTDDRPMALQLTFCTTTAGVTCRYSRFSPSTTKPSSISARPCSGPGTCRRPAALCGRVATPVGPLAARVPPGGFLVRLDGGRPRRSLTLDAEPGLDYVRWRKRRRTGHGGRARAERSERPDRACLHRRPDAAGTWAQARRVVIKAEVVQLAGRAPQDNPRFVVTNLRHAAVHLRADLLCPR